MMPNQESDNALPAIEITKEFLEKLVKKEITSFKLNAGSNTGDNYMSIMHAVEIRLKNEEDPLYIVVKCMPNHPTRRDFAEESNVFRKELFVYDQWIPKLLKFKDEVGAPESLQLAVATFLGGEAPDYLWTENESPPSDMSYIAMVDLRKTYGMVMADRQVGLDFAHCKIVFEELAKLHAFSWAYKQNNGIKYLTDTYPMMLETMYNTKSVEQFREVMVQIIESALDHIAAVIGPDSPVYHRTARLKGEIDIVKEMADFLGKEGIDEARAENFLRIQPPHDPDYNMEPWLVGLHGDCWVNNFLFKYDKTGGKPEKVILLDLQLCMEGCPTYDLIYFFQSSTTLETRQKHEDALLRVYHDKFVEYCTVLNSETLPGFSLSSLKRRFRRAKIMGYMTALPLLTFVLKDPETSVDLDTMGKDVDLGEMFGSVGNDAGKNMNLRKRVCDLTQELYDSGVL